MTYDYNSHFDVKETDWAYIVTLVVICVVGVFGNLLVMLVVILSQEYKKAVTHWYVLQLSIADACFLLTLPFQLDQYKNKEWRYSSSMCKAKETIVFLNYYASIMFLMIMSIDRYVAVCHRFTDCLQKLRSYSTACIITVITWIIALSLCTPIILYSNKVNCICGYVFPEEQLTPDEHCKKEGFTEGTKNWTNCILLLNETQSTVCEHQDHSQAYILGDGSGDYYYDNDYYSGYSENIPTLPEIFPECQYNKNDITWTIVIVFNFTVMFAVPVLVMAFCYAMIVIQLRKTKLKSKKSRRSSGSGNIEKRRTTRRKRRHSNASLKADNKRNRAITVCVVFVLLFVVCWFPFHVFHLSKLLGIVTKNRTWCRLLPTVANMVLYMNSALNPYIYNFLGTKLGKRFRVTTFSVRERINRYNSWSSYGSDKFKLKKKNRAGELITSSHSSSGSAFSRGKCVEMNKATFTNVTPSDDVEVKNGENSKEHQYKKISVY